MNPNLRLIEIKTEKPVLEFFNQAKGHHGKDVIISADDFKKLSNDEQFFSFYDPVTEHSKINDGKYVNHHLFGHLAGCNLYVKN